MHLVRWVRNFVLGHLTSKRPKGDEQPTSITFPSGEAPKHGASRLTTNLVSNNCVLSELGSIICDEAALGFAACNLANNLCSSALWPLMLWIVLASYNRHLTPGSLDEDLAKSLWVLWTTTSIAGCRTMVFPLSFHAIVATLMCKPVLAVRHLHCLRHWYSCIDARWTCRLSSWRLTLIAPSTQVQCACSTLPLTMHRVTFKLWSGSFFLKLWWHSDLK